MGVFIALSFTAYLLLLILGFTFFSHTPSPSDHHYNVGDPVPLFVNKVGPFNNPSETYQYYELPFCRPDQVVEKKESLGEVLSGDRLAKALYEINFGVEKIQVVLCHKKLTKTDVAKFRKAIFKDFYFQMYYDDLPFWGFIGKVEDQSWMLEGKGPKILLFKHVQFNVLYSASHVVEIHAFSDPNYFVDITKDVDQDIKFTYSVFWNEVFWNDTSSHFRNRVDRYSKTSILPVHRKIHWFSFINAVVIILLLMGLLSVLFLRHLKNDLRKYSSGDEEEDKEVGWKYIHGDVFRCPPRLPLLSAILGSGSQMLTVIFLLSVLSFCGILYPYSRGALSASLVMVYIFTSAVAGYNTASFCKQFSGTGWERSVLSVGMLFLGPFLLTVFILNTVAIHYGATAALPFGTMFVIVFLYVLVAIPLLAVGGLIGYRFRSVSEASSATKKCPREIPSLSWYQKCPCQMFLGGLLPFSAIVLELHHLYSSIWGYKIYTSPAILLIMFIILVILTGMLSIGLTYIQLIVEDYEWWWRSILRGGSVAIFMFCYSIYFYLKSNMSGFLQMSFFFGYNACMCYAFFLMLGTISFHVSLMFVQRIYRTIKSE